MKKETWFSRNSKALAFFIGVAFIASAVLLYLFPPSDKAGSQASGQGFILPFIVVLAIIGVILVLLAFDVIQAYLRARKARKAEHEPKSAEPPTPAGP